MVTRHLAAPFHLPSPTLMFPAARNRHIPLHTVTCPASQRTVEHLEVNLRLRQSILKTPEVNPRLRQGIFETPEINLHSARRALESGKIDLQKKKVHLHELEVRLQTSKNPHQGAAISPISTQSPVAAGANKVAAGASPWQRALSTASTHTQTPPPRGGSYHVAARHPAYETAALGHHRNSPLDRPPYTWDWPNPNVTWSGICEPGDEGYIPPPNTPSTSNRHRQSQMKQNSNYPTNMPAQILGLTNCFNKQRTHATALGLSTAAVNAAIAEARWLIYLLGSFNPAGKTWAKSITDFVREAQTGSGEDVMPLPTFTQPPLPPADVEADLPAVIPVKPGALTRLFSLVQVIQESHAYTDTEPHPAALTQWKYRAIYRVGDAQVGLWSAEVSVVVGG